MSSIDSRFARLEVQINNIDFRENMGKANEVNYHIFDYDAKDELIIREKIDDVSKKYTNIDADFNIKVFDLYDIIIEILEREGFLEICFDFEKRKGINEITIAINEMLKMEEDNQSNEILAYIKNNINDNSVVFIKGVGKCFPFLRSHKILNNLHQFIDNVPVIMFYPGKYDGGSPMLFSEIKDDNFYRAFRFI